VGRDFHALKMSEAASPKLRAPSLSYVFKNFHDANQIQSDNFITLGSLAPGGLSNAWGCGVACLTDSELSGFPYLKDGLNISYERVGKRIGISGRIHDDLTDYFALDHLAEPPVEMDLQHSYLASNYAKHKKYFLANNFKMGRARVAVLTKDMKNRYSCNLCQNCLWGCSRGSMYSAKYDLDTLRSSRNFKDFSGFIVDDLNSSGLNWEVSGKFSDSGERRTFIANQVILAAGTLASTRLVLKYLGYRSPVKMLSSPTAAFMLWMPKLLGTQVKSGFGLGQLSFVLDLDANVSAFGSTFNSLGMPTSEFIKYIPIDRRNALNLFQSIATSTLIGNIFLPGNFTDASVYLDKKNILKITGGYKKDVHNLFERAYSILRKSYWKMGAIILPGSFKIAMPGSDIHYSGTLPMKKIPKIGESSEIGEISGMKGVFSVDGASLPLLLEKSHTFTIMANADRIGTLLAERLRN